ncbi:MAG: HEAT repeat domain-containing protein [Anaerolineae bacterium]|nr:HEAT repeat domain-containing protein [Anaerolineae bacterium]
MSTDLIDQFLSSNDARCEALAVSLGEQGASGLQTLQSLLTAAEADVRFWAVRGLWANGSGEAIQALIATLQDPDPMVSSGAALALGELKAEAAVEALAHLLVTDPGATGRHAADALAKIGQAATPALTEALKNEQPWVRVRAAKALVPLEDRASIGPLFHVLEDDSYLVRHYAELALERMGVGQMVYF